MLRCFRDILIFLGIVFFCRILYIIQQILSLYVCVSVCVLNHAIQQDKIFHKGVNESVKGRSQFFKRDLQSDSEMFYCNLKGKR